MSKTDFACGLSDSQLAIYTYSKANKLSNVYQIDVKFGPFIDIDVDRLIFALKSAIDKHYILKTIIKCLPDGSPYMYCCFNQLPIVDVVESLDNYDYTISLDSRLYRIAILKQVDVCFIIVCVHHIIFDGYSMNVFMSDVSSIYLNKTLPFEKKTFFDFVEAEKLLKATSAYENALHYFKENFSCIDNRIVPLPDCYQKPSKQETFTKKIDIDVATWKSICQHFNCSENVLSVTTFAIVLGCFCGENCAKFSTVFHGRHGSNYNNSIGMFVKTIPVFVTWNSCDTIEILLSKTRWQLARSMVNDAISFVEVKKICGLDSDISFVFQGYTNHTELFCEQKMLYSFINCPSIGSSLSMDLWYVDGFLSLNVEYDSAKYSVSFIESMIETFACVAKSLEKYKKVVEIPLVSAKGLNLLNGFNQNKYLGKCGDVVSMFSNVANKYPKNIAIKFLNKTFTYKQLDIFTDKIANYLLQLGVCNGKKVALLIERNEMMVVLPLAVLKTGASFVPLSINLPIGLINSQLQTCDAYILLSYRLFANLNIHTILIDDLIETIENGNQYTLPNTKRDKFAVFFTSGSTSLPKGVVINHKNVAAYCLWYHHYFDIKEGVVVAAYNNFSFDAFLTDVFPALTCGATVAIVESGIKHNISELAKFCDYNCVKIIDLPTQIGRLFVSNKKCKTLQHVVLGGEKVSPFYNCANYKVYNQYGPTETTIAATIYKIDGSEVEIPIGKPLNGLKIYIVDKFKRRLPIGAIGEIIIAGNQVADGYIDAQDNVGKFIINPFDSRQIYKNAFSTGDFARYKFDGNIEFVGRRDGLVKIRGYRIDIEYVENKLRLCSYVCDAAVGIFKNEYIVGYIVGRKQLDIEKVRIELSNLLPNYMMPFAIQQIDCLPTTSNGKIDRNKLPNILLSKPKQTNRQKSILQSVVCNAFADALDVTDVSLDDNFFDLGGSSISAMQVVVGLENKGVNIDYSDIFNYPTAYLLSEFLQNKTNNQIKVFKSSLKIKLNNSTCLQNLKYKPLGDIILTGATGFLGIHILYEILTNYKSKIYCVVRSKQNMSAYNRLDNISSFYFGTSLLKQFKDRIIVVDCNLTEPNFLSKLDFIGEPNLTVVNCAAVVKHFAEKSYIEAVNVDVVDKLINFCLKHNYDFVHTSTLSACYQPNIIVDEEMFCGLPNNSIPYIQTKWQAEQLVFDAVARGLNMKIIRVGNLCARSYDSVFQINANENASMNFVDIVKKLHCYPVSLKNKYIDFTPVDLAAKDFVKLLTVDYSTLIFHVFRNKVLINEVAKAEAIDDSVFKDKVDKISLLLGQQLSYFYNNGVGEWNNSFTQRVLNALENLKM